MSIRMRHLLLTILVLTTSLATFAQQSRLKSGPMLGHIDMREATIWVQTTQGAEVYATYQDTEAPSRQYRTATVTTSTEHAFTAHLLADSAEPGRTYTYTIYVNDEACSFPYPTRFTTQPIWKWRGDDLPTASLMIGSCFYVNEPGYERERNGVESGYGSEFEILKSMTNTSTDVMVWLGDNVYLREPDWNSRSGMFKRYSHTRAYPGLQPFLASRAHYAIWDDHDYGPNNSDETYWGKQHALDAHAAFWPNPSYGLPGMPGITTTFELIDVQVFLLDDRWYRSAERRVDGKKTILGDAQIEWLIGALASSTATFKIIAVGSQFLTTDLRKECFMHVPEERRRLIEAITANKISGVMFITGDVHGAELSKLERYGSYPLYEFTSSAITAGSNKGIADQPNDFRVEGTAFGGHNYGTITVSGKRKERVLTLRLFDKDGAMVWEKILSEEDLR